MNTHPSQIMQYYSELHNKGKELLEGNDKPFLSHVDVLTLDFDQQQILAAQVSVEEVKVAILKLKNGKSPGFEEFSVDWYIVFLDLLVSKLYQFRITFFGSGSLPLLIYEPYSALVSKHHKEHTEYANHRPIYLMN